MELEDSRKGVSLRMTQKAKLGVVAIAFGQWVIARLGERALQMLGPR